MTEPLVFDLVTYSQPSCGRHPDDTNEDVKLTIEAAKQLLRRDTGVNFVLAVSIGSTDPADMAVSYRTGWATLYRDPESRAATILTLLPLLLALSFGERWRFAWALLRGRAITNYDTFLGRKNRGR